MHNSKYLLTHLCTWNSILLQYVQPSSENLSNEWSVNIPIHTPPCINLPSGST